MALSKSYNPKILIEFLEDDFFVRWAIRPDAESDAFWQSFLLKHPEKEEAVKQAAAFIRAYRQQDTFANEDGKELLWKRIGATLDNQRPIAFVPSRSFYRKMAAAVALLIVSSVVLWMLSGTEQIVTTAYGEVKTIILPDQSMVTLNGNSSLKYKTSWNRQFSREVWMEGEGYFDVKHINKGTTQAAQGERFIVHSDEVNIEVLGTAFDVRHRRDQTCITLITGKVTVQTENESLKSAGSLIMLPGDQAEYLKTKLVEKKRLANPKAVTGWINHEFIFSNPQLNDIFSVLSDDYGYEIKAEEALRSLSIEGDISVSSVEELLSTVEVALGLQIEKSGPRIVIGYK